MKLNDRVHVAAVFADMLFTDKGQRYGQYPYAKHLQDVHDVLLRFDVTDRNLLTAAFLHDILEDTDVSRETIQDIFGHDVALLVYAVTDEKGENRKERKALTYPKIRTVTGATQLKLADRIANIENSLRTDEMRMFRMYRKEHAGFSLALRVLGEYDEMWDHLAKLMVVGSEKLSTQLVV